MVEFSCFWWREKEHNIAAGNDNGNDIFNLNNIYNCIVDFNYCVWSVNESRMNMSPLCKTLQYVKISDDFW